MSPPPLLTPSLAALDTLQAEDLVLGLFSDVRPLGGVAGLVDWRLNGLLSRFVMDGRLGGSEDEQVLMPAAGRLGAQRLFVFGLGERSQYGKRVAGLAQTLPELLKRAGARRVALALPGPSRTTGAHLARLIGALGDRVVCVFDDDGKLADWLEGGKSSG